MIGYYSHLFTIIATPTVLWRPLNYTINSRTKLVPIARAHALCGRGARGF